MKKTLTPLNDVCTRRAQHMKRAHDNAIDRCDDALNVRATLLQIKNARVAKHSMK
jgi:hypothetical protein